MDILRELCATTVLLTRRREVLEQLLHRLLHLTTVGSAARDVVSRLRAPRRPSRDHL